VKSWEYLFYSPPDDGDMEKEVDGLGETGWELVTAYGLQLIFKRPRP
jgi:hypothetical protein